MSPHLHAHVIETCEPYKTYDNGNPDFHVFQTCDWVEYFSSYWAKWYLLSCSLKTSYFICSWAICGFRSLLYLIYVDAECDNVYIYILHNDYIVMNHYCFGNTFYERNEIHAAPISLLSDNTSCATKMSHLLQQQKVWKFYRIMPYGFQRMQINHHM